MVVKLFSQKLKAIGRGKNKELTKAEYELAFITTYAHTHTTLLSKTQANHHSILPTNTYSCISDTQS